MERRRSAVVMMCSPRVMTLGARKIEEIAYHEGDVVISSVLDMQPQIVHNEKAAYGIFVALTGHGTRLNPLCNVASLAETP